LGRRRREPVALRRGPRRHRDRGRAVARDAAGGVGRARRPRPAPPPPRGMGRAVAAEAFAHPAAYDAAVAGWFASDDAAMPAFVGLAFDKVTDLRYGENPHQRGAFYRGSGGPGVW